MGIFKDLKALAQGLQIAGKHLGRHAVTVQYPEQRDKVHERSRAMVVLLSDKETGELNCTACLLCERVCPTAAIDIDCPRDENNKKQLKQFTLDNTLCCFCGLCEEACNFSAIKLATKFEFSSYNVPDLVWDIKKLQEWGEDVPYEDTRRRKNPVNKIGPAAETKAANETLEIEKKKKAAEAAKEAARKKAEGDEGGAGAEKPEAKPEAKPADTDDKKKPADTGSASTDTAGDAKDKDSGTDSNEEGKA